MCVHRYFIPFMYMLVLSFQRLADKMSKIATELKIMNRTRTILEHYNYTQIKYPHISD